MKSSNLVISSAFHVALLGLIAGALGCDTSFGQPCALPKTEEFRRACDPAAQDGPDAGEGGVVKESKASCAVKNYAGCETRVCLVYRGSDPFCSEPCAADSDCERSATCRPLFGDTDLDPAACTPSDGFTPECYCVKKGDSAR